MSAIRYSDFSNLDEAIIGFTSFCRQHDLRVGLSHTLEAIDAARKGFIHDKETLRYALKSMFCTSEEDFGVYDRCFDIYWHRRQHDYTPTQSSKGKSNIAKTNKASVVMMGFNLKGSDRKAEEEEDAKNVSGASKIEALKKTDFSHVSAIDSEILDKLAEQLLRQLNHKLKRKFESSKKGKIDIRRTIRGNLSTGEMLHLTRKNRKLEKYRVILLLDVSGSMDKYSFFLLKFIWSLKSNLKNIEAFIFSTHLVRITSYLDQKQLDKALFELSHNTNNWSSGTKIGACLEEFNNRYSKRILNGKSITIVLSDGLDDGQPDLLQSELHKIKMRTSRLVWLNPLKGMKGYEPIAKGMSAALHEVDTFASAHNLDSLLELENILADV